MKKIIFIALLIFIAPLGFTEVKKDIQPDSDNITVISNKIDKNTNAIQQLIRASRDSKHYIQSDIYLKSDEKEKQVQQEIPLLTMIAAIIGIMGGLLGFYSFVDKYLMRFKPKIFIGNKVIANISERNSKTSLDSIIVSLQLCNHRKKYGVIHDFAIRMYQTNIINPDIAIYFIYGVSDKSFNSIDELIEKKNYQVFKPIVLTPDYNNSVNIFASELRNRSKMYIEKNEPYFIELYYQKTTNGKWCFISKSYLFYDNNMTKENYVVYSILDKGITRNKLKPIHLETTLYAGASTLVIENYFKSIRFKIVHSPFYWIKDKLLIIPYYLYFIYLFSTDRVRLSIIKKYAKTIKRTKYTWGNPEYRPITEKALDNIYKTLGKILKEINKTATTEAKLGIEYENNSIVLSRSKLKLLIYISGDINIHIAVLENSSQTKNPLDALIKKTTRKIDSNSRLNYSITLKNGKYWYLDNYGLITIDSFAIKVLDAFVVHSQY
ncbi:MAG: hypothetical protein PHS59_17985 [Paludibacter sp.]|nr:hypothetical protein [Paludibacter sp.]